MKNLVKSGIKVFDVICVLIGLLIIAVNTYLFILKKVSFLIFFGTLVLFGGGIWVLYLSYKGKGVPIGIKYGHNFPIIFTFDFLGILLGLFFFFFAFTFPLEGDNNLLNLILRIVLFICAIFFGIGGLCLMFNDLKKKCKKEKDSSVS